MEKTNYPGVFLRAKAAIIDSIVIIILIIGITDLFSNFENVPDYAKIIAFIFIFILYEPLMISTLGSTIGHKMNNLKVQRLDNGKKVSLGLAIIRYIVKAILGWISFFTVSTNENNQAIHDSIANSIVIYDELPLEKK